MIKNPSTQIRLAHQLALEIPKSYDKEDPQEQLRCSLWTKVFQAAEVEADRINQTSPRNLEAIDVVNEWYLDLENDAQVSHDFRAHDRTTGFKTISQELKDEETAYNREAEALWEIEYRKWWFAGKVGIKPIKPKPIHLSTVNYGDYETFSHGAHSETYEDVESLEMLRERRADIRQDSAEDPENPYETERGDRRLAFNRSLFDRHDPKNPKLKYRGQKGCLSGVYTTTDPEPTYRTPQGRKNLLKALLSSDNVIDVILAKGMNRKFTFPADRKAQANARRLQLT